MIGILTLPLVLITGVAHSDTVRARLLASIGESTPTPFLIGEVSGLALDDSGRVFVTDFQDPRVLVFALDGTHLATIGRQGRGPGEFTAPTGPVIGPDGALYIRNMEHVARFVRDPRTRLPSAFDRTFPGPPMAPWRSKLASVIDRAGRFHFPLEVGLRRDTLTYFAYQRYSLAGVELDSIPVPTYSTTRSKWASYNSRMIAGFNVVPFHPSPAWTVSVSGTIVSGPADKYELRETDSTGRVLRTITRAVGPARVPARERAESLRALKRRIDSLPVPVSRLYGASEEVIRQRLPEDYPAYRGLLALPSGELWVRRWSPPSFARHTVLDVFDRGGVYRRTIVLPMNCSDHPALVARGSTIACVEVELESGAESVVVATLLGMDRR